MIGDRLVPRAPVLVLGVGNRLLGDDGFGQELLELVERDFEDEARVECVDGGTLGLALLGCLEDRSALLVLDAAELGADPGAMRVVRGGDGDDAARPRDPARSGGAHGGSALELLVAARLLGVLPEVVDVLGVQPEALRTRVGLSSSVRSVLPRARGLAGELVREYLAALEGTEPGAGSLERAESVEEARPCTS